MRVLWLSAAGPPVLSAEGLQVGRLLSALPRKELEVTWITDAPPQGDEGGWARSLPELEGQIPQWIQVIRVRTFGRHRWMSALVRTLPVLARPDAHQLFHQRVRGVLRRNGLEAVDLVYARSSPASSLIAGWKAAEMLRRPLVVHLSDPWVDDPWHWAALGSSSSQRYSRRWEERIFRRASQIHVTSERTLEWYRARYPYLSVRFRVMPNVYDPADIARGPPPDDPPFTVLHVGNLFGSRTFEPILRSLRRMKERSRISLDHLRFLNVGHAYERELQRLRRNWGFQTAHRGSVPPSKVRELRARSHVLVTIGSLDGGLRLMSKIPDSLAARRPIWAWVQGEGEERDLLGGVDDGSPARHLGRGRSFAPGDEEHLDRWLDGLWERFKEGGGREFLLDSPPKEFAAPFVARRLVEAFREAAKSVVRVEAIGEQFRSRTFIY